MQQEFDKKETQLNIETKEKLNKNISMSSPFDNDNIAYRTEIEEIKADLSDAVAQCDIREIFDYFDIGVFIQRDGSFGLSEYKQPSDDIKFSDIGINEEELIKNVVKISGNADFRKSSLNNFGKISYIGGRADFRQSNFKFNTRLPKINGKIIFCEHQTLLYGVFMKIFYNIKRLLNR